MMQDSTNVLQFANIGWATLFRANSTSYNKLLCAPAPLALPGCATLTKSGNPNNIPAEVLRIAKLS